MTTQHKKGDFQKAYETCRFWMMLMITRLRKRWRTTRFWVWLQPQQDFERDERPKWCTKELWAWLQPQQESEVQAMKEESRFWTALQFGWKVPTSSLEGKADGPWWISRLRARTPCCKQLFGEYRILREWNRRFTYWIEQEFRSSNG